MSNRLYFEECEKFTQKDKQTEQLLSVSIFYLTKSGKKYIKCDNYLYPHGYSEHNALWLKEGESLRQYVDTVEKIEELEKRKTSLRLDFELFVNNVHSWTLNKTRVENINTGIKILRKKIRRMVELETSGACYALEIEGEISEF